jgi:hypothetical protein
MARIKTTRTVRVALWAVRLYLLILLTLIGLIFLRLSNRRPMEAKPAPAALAAPVAP